MRKSISKSFNVSYTISFSGKTRSDGIKTITPEIVKDKVLGVLDELLHQQLISEYNVSAQINHQEKKK